MRNGELKVITPLLVASEDRHPRFMLEVSDDEGAFTVISQRWVHDRWAGAAPIRPTTERHFRTVETMMLREADRRRHDGSFDRAHPMSLEDRARPS